MRTLLTKLAVFLGVVLLAVPAVQAQFQQQNAVGGVSIDPTSGVLTNQTADVSGKLRQLRQEMLQAVPADLKSKTTLRKISLRRLQEEIARHLEAGQPLPDEIRYLAGLQRVEYVFVYPEQNDIVLAGPAEGWRVDEAGNIVGQSSGHPVLHLDDLLVALRAAHGEVKPIFQCSIDPTQEGLQRLQALQRQWGGRLRANPAVIAKQMEQALGPQKITIQGVEGDTRFAAVMVAADYRMKRLAMGMEKAPVAGMPSFLQLGPNPRNMFPRWWLATNYDALLRSEEGDAWQIRGQGVKVLTENTFFAKTNGNAERVDRNAKRWADTMTEKYAELAEKLPIFHDLRNVMDLAVVSALIAEEQLAQKAGLEIGLLLDEKLPVMELIVPKQVPTGATFLKRGRQTTFTASGGVDLNPWAVAGKNEVSPTLNAVRTKAVQAKPQTWWWN